MPSSRAPTVVIQESTRPQYGGEAESAEAERQRMLDRLRYEQGQRSAAATQQQGALSLYRDAATGRTPSAAQNLLRQQTDQNVQNQMALAAQGRGGNVQSMQRQGASAGLGAQLTGQQQIATLRAQEQEAGRAGYAATAQQMAGNALAGTQLGEGTLQGLNLGEMQAGTQAAIAQAEINQRMNEAAMQAASERRRQNMALGQSMAQATGSLLGGIGGMMSDERVKDDVREIDDDARETIAALAPVSWKYKPGVKATFGKGQHVLGILAQDLEKTKMGAALVHETPQGKSVNIGGAASLALASAADHERRMRKLEAKNAG